MPETPTDSFNDIVLKTDRLLWDAYSSSVSGNYQTTAARLVFPKYRADVVRVSEQEARFLLISQLNASPFLYSIETPTTGEYSFKEDAQGKRSAATDVTVYTEQLSPLYNVEFKAHGFSLDRQGSLEITKDVVKLLREPVSGFWFHTLEATDNSTIKKLWSVIRRDLKLVGEENKELVATRRFVFHVCVLRQRFAMQTEVEIRPESVGPDWLNDFPDPDYEVTRQRLVSVDATVPWTSHSG